MVTATMRISGGHLNPAVTLGLLVARRTDVADRGRLHRHPAPRRDRGGGGCSRRSTPPAVLRADAPGHPAPGRAPSALTQGIAVEAILAFFLVSAVFGTCVNPEAPQGRRVRRSVSRWRFDILVGGGAHRRGGESGAGFRPGAGRRRHGGADRLLDRADPGRGGGRRCCGSTCCCRSGTSRRLGDQRTRALKQ